MLSGKHSIRIFSVSVFVVFLLHVFPVHALGLILNFDNDTWAGDGDWSNLSNWAEGILPDAWDDVMITAHVDTNSDLPAHVASLSFTGNGYLNISVTVDNDATFSQNASIGNAGTIIGDVTFVDNAFNDGAVTGVSTFNDSAANYGTLLSDAVFNGSNINWGTISGNAIFRDSSYNAIGSIISGNADFYDVSYNAGTVSGTAKFHMYTAVGSEVSISGDANFQGTGIVGGDVLDATDTIITGWQLTNSSRLNNGFLQGDISLSDMSQNFGTVSGDAVFQNSADNSGGIVQWNATFQNDSYNGGIVMGNAHFYDLSENQWSIRGNATYMVYTGLAGIVEINGNTNFYGTGNVDGSIFDSLGLPIGLWNLRNASVLNGTLKGDATLYDTSLNNGIILWNGVFYNSSVNNGTLSRDGRFNDTTTNAWTVMGDAYFIPTATNTGTGIIGWTSHIIEFPAPSTGGGGGRSSLSERTEPPLDAIPVPVAAVEPQIADSIPEEVYPIPAEAEDPFISLDPTDMPVVEKPTEVPIPVATSSDTVSQPSLRRPLIATSIPDVAVFASDDIVPAREWIQYGTVCQLLFGTDELYILLDKRICDVFSVTHPLSDFVRYDTDREGDVAIAAPVLGDHTPLMIWAIFFIFLTSAWFWLWRKKIR